MTNKIYKYRRNTFIFSLFIFLTTLVNAQNNALILNGGYAVLNGGTSVESAYIVVNQPNTSGIVRNGGHINSENQYHYIKWVAGTSIGTYIFPFGVGASPLDYIPFTFNKTTAGASDVLLSTWFTDVQNLPKPAATNVGAVTNMFGTADSVLYAIDRFWDIQASATADLTFSYRGIENTTSTPTSIVKAQHWNGTSWDAPVTSGTSGVTTGIGTAGAYTGQTTFSPWVLVTTACTPDTFTQYPVICQGDSFVIGTSVYTTPGTYIDTLSGTSGGAVRDTFYFETFDGPITWTLNQSTGINGSDNNFWVINDNEGGVAPSGCGVAGNGDNSLHITSVFNPSGGAAYDAGGLCGILFCPETNMAASSANISTIGKTNIALNFDFISNGDGLNDNASVLYSDNGGTTWNSISSSIKSPICGSGQGQWTFSTSNLPVNAENISNLRLRFNWTNNDDAIGGDPSVAINNVYLTYDSISSAACDSIITTNLTVNPIATAIDVQTACNSYTWIDGVTYLSSTNIPTDTLIASNGCDSVVTLNLTINTFASGTDVQSACSSLTWIDGINYTVSTNTPTFTIVGGSVEGCDSVVTLDLTINPISTSTDIRTACNSLTWIDGINYTASINTPTFTIVGGSAAGCDSVITLNLTINPTATSNDVQTACNTYTWIDGNTYSTSTITPTFTIVGGSTAGCDSVITLNLTINPTATSNDVQTACNTYTWIDGNTYSTSTITPTFTIVGGSSVGCDSVVTLNLTINPQLSATPNAVAPICLGDPLNLTATSSGNGILTWYNDATGASTIGTGNPCSPSPTVSASGTYTYYVNEDGICPSALIPVNVVVNGVTAVIGATPTSGFMPLDVVFTNGSPTGLTYTWNFGDGTATSNQFEPNHTYTSIGNYTATLTVTDGVCPATASITIEVNGQSSILIPNVFTPNGDDQNDVFTVEGTNLESVEAEIFNRWGLSMYNWNQVNGGWNGRTSSGTEVPDGTYFYIINAKGLDGVEYFKKGAFSLIR